MEQFQIDQLTFTYNEAQMKTLTDISFSVSQGEFLVICGLSGSGKSTLLRQLKSCMTPYGEQSGSILFEGKPLETVDFRTQSQKIGFVTQSPDNQSVTDKVWHELAFGLESLGLDNVTIRQRTAELAAFFGIEKWYEKSVDELSGGQKQLLNLGSVMVMRPSVLILDEPTSQLDPIASENFIAMLMKINRELGTTVIMTEHSLGEIFPICDRIIVMSDGKIVSDNTPREICHYLYQQKNEMFDAVPSPARIYEYANIDNVDNSNVPLSVAEGKVWLKKLSQSRPLQKLPKNEVSRHSFPPKLMLDNVYFRYHREMDDVIKGLSLKAYSGELLAVIGGNGAGKTTLFSLICGMNKPYRGKMMLDGKWVSSIPSDVKTVMLPQNPSLLFVKDTVEKDLFEVLENTKVSSNEMIEKINSVVNLCGIGELLDRHPYDLSGGEQQKAALAKLLLTEPDILLLDEPTKGLDAHYKKHFAAILRQLAKEGAALIMVSHDMEFCAQYADRCAFLFNGDIVGEDSPRNFFSDNRIYTTQCSRMAGEIIDKAVTEYDVLYALGIKYKKWEPPVELPFSQNTDRTKKHIEKSCQKKQHRFWKWSTAFLLTVVFVCSVFAALGTMEIPLLSGNTIFSYFLMFGSAGGTIAVLGNSSRSIKIARSKRSFYYTLITLFVMIVIVPLTVMAGIIFFDNTKYLFISLVVMLESIFPFYIIFEKRQIHARELVLVAVMCSVCVAGRAVFYMLPQFKPVTALVIIAGAALGSETGFLIGSVTMLASNLFFGQGAWTPWQMFTMGLIGFLSGLVFERGLLPPNKMMMSAYGFMCSFLYGAVMNPSTLILTGTPLTSESLLTVYAYGLPMDTVHAVSTALFLYIGAEPMIVKLERIKQKYGLIR